MKEKVTFYFVLVLASISLVYFIFSAGSLISPILTFFFILFLLYPVRSNLYASRLLWISWIAFGMWFFSSVSDLLFPFIVAFVLAYLFEPVVRFLTRHRVSRSLAALIITIFGIGAIILFIILLAPLVIDQLHHIGRFLKDVSFDNVVSILPLELLDLIGMKPSEVESIVINLFTSRLSSVGEFISVFLSNALANIGGVFSIVLGIMIIPFLSLYFLSDFPVIMKTLRSLIPEMYMDRYDEFSGLANKILRQYIRGQLIVVGILTVIYIVVFWIVDVPYPFLLGLTYGVMSFIPYIGGIISLGISGLVSLLSEHPLHAFTTIAIVYGAVHGIENFILVPRIIGKTVALNPIVLFLSLFIFGRFLGFVGILLAVPLSAFLVAILNKYYIVPNSSRNVSANLRAGTNPTDDVAKSQ